MGKNLVDEFLNSDECEFEGSFGPPEISLKDVHIS